MSVMLKIQFNRDLNYGIFKNKKRLFSSYTESPIFNTNPNDIKLRMLQEGLKYKQLQEKV